MLGIFQVYIPLIYGEGKTSALRRLQEEIDKNSHAVQDSMHCTLTYRLVANDLNSYSVE
jgi:hypothetical protein